MAIVWTVTSNQKRMPVDPDPVAVPRGFRLADPPAGTSDESPIATFTMTPAPDERLYQSHFVTCPDGAQHRRPRT
jgi:hypothetical protein